MLHVPLADGQNELESISTLVGQISFVAFFLNLSQIFFTWDISHVCLLATPSATNQSIKAILGPDSAHPPLIWTIAEIFPIRLVGHAGTENPHLSRLAPHLNHRSCCCQSARVKFNNCFAHWFPSLFQKNIFHQILYSKISWGVFTWAREQNKNWFIEDSELQPASCFNIADAGVPAFVIEFVSWQQEVIKCECTLWLFESLHLAGELAVDERERKWWKHSSTPEANGSVTSA